jgi:molybdate transport system ATP-binding protein
MKSSFLTIQNILPRIFNSPFPEPFSWKMNAGEIWSVLGPNGSGKSLLADMICGNQSLRQGVIDYHFLEETNAETLKQAVRVISFNTVYGMADYREAYYQMRFNNPDADSAPFVASLFHPDEADTDVLHEVIEQLNLRKLMDRRLVQLSSGELRKLLIAKILMEKPRMLIFDNPYVGLDTSAREHLNEIFPHINQSGIQLLFLVPSVTDLPPCTSHILEIKNGMRVTESEAHQYKPTKLPEPEPLPEINWAELIPDTDTLYDIAVRMENVKVAYGERIICQHIDWEVRRGEKWALLGPNGSGKSTLLSFVSADNPKAYSQNLTLFGQRRGSGETIWDIKKRIGFTSSEMHLYYRQNVSCLEVVESGFFDSVGLYQECYEQKTLMARKLLEALGLGALDQRRFNEVSSGQQRMVLLARALVKNPELLILDEPFQGLDDAMRQRGKQLVESFCSQPDKTLIFVTHQQSEIPDCVNRQLQLMK